MGKIFIAMHRERRPEETEEEFMLRAIEKSPLNQIGDEGYRELVLCNLKCFLSGEVLRNVKRIHSSNDANAKLYEFTYARTDERILFTYANENTIHIEFYMPKHNGLGKQKVSKSKNTLSIELPFVDNLLLEIKQKKLFRYRQKQQKKLALNPQKFQLTPLTPDLAEPLPSAKLQGPVFPHTNAVIRLVRSLLIWIAKSHPDRSVIEHLEINLGGPFEKVYNFEPESVLLSNVSFLNFLQNACEYVRTYGIEVWSPPLVRSLLNMQAFEQECVAPLLQLSDKDLIDCLANYIVRMYDEMDFDISLTTIFFNAIASENRPCVDQIKNILNFASIVTLLELPEIFEEPSPFITFFLFLKHHNILCLNPQIEELIKLYPHCNPSSLVRYEHLFLDFPDLFMNALNPIVLSFNPEDLLKELAIGLWLLKPPPEVICSLHSICFAPILKYRRSTLYDNGIFKKEDDKRIKKTEFEKILETASMEFKSIVAKWRKDSDGFFPSPKLETLLQHYLEKEEIKSSKLKGEIIEKSAIEQYFMLYEVQNLFQLYDSNFIFPKFKLNVQLDSLIELLKPPKKENELFETLIMFSNYLTIFRPTVMQIMFLNSFFNVQLGELPDYMCEDLRMLQLRFWGPGPIGTLALRILEFTRYNITGLLSAEIQLLRYLYVSCAPDEWVLIFPIFIQVFSGKQLSPVSSNSVIFPKLMLIIELYKNYLSALNNPASLYDLEGSGPSYDKLIEEIFSLDPRYTLVNPLSASVNMISAKLSAENIFKFILNIFKLKIGPTGDPDLLTEEDSQEMRAILRMMCSDLTLNEAFELYRLFVVNPLPFLPRPGQDPKLIEAFVVCDVNAVNANLYWLIRYLERFGPSVILMRKFVKVLEKLVLPYKKVKEFRDTPKENEELPEIIFAFFIESIARENAMDLRALYIKILNDFITLKNADKPYPPRFLIYFGIDFYIKHLIEGRSILDLSGTTNTQVPAYVPFFKLVTLYPRQKRSQEIIKNLLIYVTQIPETVLERVILADYVKKQVKAIEKAAEDRVCLSDIEKFIKKLPDDPVFAKQGSTRFNQTPKRRRSRGK